MKVTSNKKITNTEPSIIKSNLQKLQIVKKVNKRGLSSILKRPQHHCVFFGGQRASGLRHRKRNAQIICIGS
jgi:hypothetical protein